MIARLTGRVVEKGPAALVLDVGGVGYEVTMAPSSLVNLPEIGEETTIVTYLHVKEDAMQLYGFFSAEEKELFLHLTSVSGVGPKVALSVLSAFSPVALKKAIISEDVELLQAIPGIGKKSAGRLVVELKDRLDLPELVAGGAVARGTAPVLIEVRDALVGLGYSTPEAAKAVEGLAVDEGATTEDILKAALKALAG